VKELDAEATAPGWRGGEIFRLLQFCSFFSFYVESSNFRLYFFNKIVIYEQWCLDSVGRSRGLTHFSQL
jgi:hypothetical protein